ncbi:hypothetical protein [Hyphomicrobium sp.]|uniref:hypothetical protein n=1 Tax=Hyphomicrobium sp. TaxID=82 RepID=UPI001DA66284|nr:hypothetical protein [Hyphomicrobium sp.]MBY0562465.1 hypothetical protein [Hyphomicrobium sp.]
MNQYPRGKLNADDEGALAFRIGVSDKTIIIDFGKPVTWIGLDKATALALIANLTQYTETL